MTNHEFIQPDARTTVTVIRNTHGGWEVREEHDSKVVRQVSYTDWHRVERAVQAISLKKSK